MTRTMVFRRRKKDYSPFFQELVIANTKTKRERYNVGDTVLVRLKGKRRTVGTFRAKLTYIETVKWSDFTSAMAQMVLGKVKRPNAVKYTMAGKGDLMKELLMQTKNKGFSGPNTKFYLITLEELNE